MTALQHDLPEGMLEWVEERGGGRATRLERHVARREAWIVDVTRPDGSVLEGFLRLQREGSGPDPRRLERETRITEALGRTDIPVAAVHGWNPELRAALFARDPGDAAIDRLDDPARQRAIMEDFIRAIARVHRIDPADLALDDVMGPPPKSAREAVLGDVEQTVRQWDRFLSNYADPLTHYALDWLRRFASEEVARVSLVQGDTGPVNFMFQDDRVSAIVDWETAHWGDPLEDLGNIWVREFFNPCGGLEGLFDLYAREAGVPYRPFAAQYYAVHQNFRGMVPIHFVCQNAHPRESVAAYYCYRYVSDRATCEMLGMAMGIEIDRPAMPEDSGDADVLADAAIHSLTHDIESALDDPFARSRARDVARSIACMDRRRRYGARLEAQECDELGALLGARPATQAEGFERLVAEIRERRIADEPLVAYLARHAYRDEWLYAPAVEMYPARTWSAIDPHPVDP